MLRPTLFDLGLYISLVTHYGVKKINIGQVNAFETWINAMWHQRNLLILRGYIYS